MRGGGGMAGAALFSIAPLDVDGEVSQLTLDRLTLLRGIMQGFARCYDLFEPNDQPAPSVATSVAGGCHLLSLPLPAPHLNACLPSVSGCASRAGGRVLAGLVDVGGRALALVRSGLASFQKRGGGPVHVGRHCEARR